MNWIDIILYIIAGIVALRFIIFLWDIFTSDPDVETMSFSELTSFFESDLKRAVRRGRKR